MPKISIILPTHNGAKFIRRAISSVRSQTYQDWELLVINDGSTDQTGALITEIATTDQRIRIFRFEQNKGIQKALNEGLMQSKGEYIGRIDDDDVWSNPAKLEKQLLYLEKNPDCVLLGTGIIVQDEAGDEIYRFLNPISDENIRRRILYRNCFSHSSVIFKKEAVMQFNGYAESDISRHTEDYELWLKLGTVGTFANLPDYAVRFTSRPGNISSINKLTQFKNQLAITAEYKNSKAYPNYFGARTKSYVRYGLYWLLGKLIPSRLQSLFIRFYKKI